MIQSALSNTSERHGPIILIAEDTPLIRANVQIPLQQNQIRFITTSDVVHAHSLIIQEESALVLINEQLPHMDGYHVCQILRKNRPLQFLPILLLQDKRDTFEPDRTLRVRLAGATASLTLPMDTNEFVQAVKKYLNKEI